jgi:hypothetical protein
MMLMVRVVRTHARLCISVQVADAARRELIIEYPYPRNSNGLPLPVSQHPAISPALVEASIRQALDSGWDPSSRGKAFLFFPPDQTT